MITGETTSIRIYNAIKTTCLSIPEVKQFNLWNNQTQRQAAGGIQPVRYPAIFVQFENEYDQLSAGHQAINGTFILYICLESLKFEDEDILRFKDNVYERLSHVLPKNGFGDFHRAFELQDTDHTNLIIWQQEYQYSYIDDLGKDQTRSVHPFDVGYNISYE